MKKLMAAVRGAGRAFRQAYNEHGEEMPDPRPIEVPLGFKKPPTLHEQIRMFVRSEEFRRRAEAKGVETFDEANDFDVGDEEFDEVPTIHEMQEEFVDQARKDADAHVERVKKAKAQRKVPEATPPKAPSAEGGDALPNAS